MNEKLLSFAKDELKHGLEQCTDDQVLMFKRMYSHGNLKASINEVVEAIPEDKLDRAMQQVQRTLDKKKAV